MKIGANLNEAEAKALKARLEAQLANTCGGEWCVDVYIVRKVVGWLGPTGGASTPEGQNGAQSSANG